VVDGACHEYWAGEEGNGLHDYACLMGDMEGAKCEGFSTACFVVIGKIKAEATIWSVARVNENGKKKNT
jgi:hypothetical protein